MTAKLNTTTCMLPGKKLQRTIQLLSSIIFVLNFFFIWGIILSFQLTYGKSNYNEYSTYQKTLVKMASVLLYIYIFLYFTIFYTGKNKITKLLYFIVLFFAIWCATAFMMYIYHNKYYMNENKNLLQINKVFVKAAPILMIMTLYMSIFLRSDK